MKELILYTDESCKKGRYYGNFYGGALVRSGDLDEVRRILHDAADAAGFTGEVKWQKVTEAYLDRYRMLMDAFFELIAEDRVKVRIMFTQNRWVPTGLTPAHQQDEYHILYYQFLKHAFGWWYCNIGGAPMRLRIYLDQLPEGGAKSVQFKRFVSDLKRMPQFREAKLQIAADQIAEIRSHDHIILQCLDIVLGAMQFRLNDMHLEKVPGKNRRGKRTVAKEKLYKYMHGKIRAIYPGFNIGITTGTPGGKSCRWTHPVPALALHRRRTRARQYSDEAHINRPRCRYVPWDVPQVELGASRSAGPTLERTITPVKHFRKQDLFHAALQ